MDDLLHFSYGKISLVQLVKINEHFVHHDEFPIKKFTLEVKRPKHFLDCLDWVLVLVNVIDLSRLLF